MAHHHCTINFFVLFLIITAHFTITVSQIEIYIVHMDPEALPKPFSSPQSYYSSLLMSISDFANAKASEPIYTYTNAIHGFSARLSPSELGRIKSARGYLSSIKDSQLQLLTTHSSDFLGLNSISGAWPASDFGNDVVIGVVDSGIWPESKSFSDEGMSEIPRRWKGGCFGGANFSTSFCNRKLIGVRFFNKGLKAANPKSNVKFMDSARDILGHGTHVSSTAAGNFVHGISYSGYASGTAKGMAPRSRLAIYKLASSMEEGFYTLDVIAAIDTVISDGVDILSLSIASSGALYEDPISITTFAATSKGVLVSQAAGNSGPSLNTISSGAPLVLIVGVGTLDREFRGTIMLGNGVVITGSSFYTLNPIPPHLPIVYTHACRSHEQHNAIGKIALCQVDSGQLEESTLVLAEAFEGTGVAGAVIILNQSDLPDNEIGFPAIFVRSANGQVILLECVVLMLSLLETKKMKLEQGMKLLVLYSWTKDRKACFCLLSILSSQLASHLFCIWLGHVTCVVVREIETRIPPTHGFLALKFRFWFFIFPHASMTDATETETVIQSRESEGEQHERAVLYLHPSDNSSFVLASSPLTGTNFLALSRAVYVSLGCKMKLGFIDSTFPWPAAGSATFEQWRRADLMRSMQVNLADTTNNAAYQFTLKNDRREGADRPMQRRKPFMDKRNVICSNCHKSGHQKDTCFQLHGVPDWYKNLSDKKKKGGGNNNFVATVEDKSAGSVVSGTSSEGHKADVVDLVSELLKLVQNRNMPSDPINNFANYAHCDDDFADLSLFLSYSKPTRPHFIHLPDGSKKIVTYIGTVKLSDKLTLNLVSFIPEFSVNLLSVNQLCKDCKASENSMDLVCDVCPKAKQPRTQFGVKVKTLRSDNGTEFINKECQSMSLFGNPPTYDHLRMFGCLGFATNLDPQRSKFHKRAHKCVFLGYAINQKAYKLYDLDEHITFTSRDVVFHEDIFPYAMSQQPVTPSLPLPITPTDCDYTPPISSGTDIFIPSHTLHDTSQPVVPTSCHPPPPIQFPRRSTRPTHKSGWLNDFEPRSFAEATKHSEWREAMKAEIHALEKNNTWKLTPLPAGKRTIGYKWVFKTKLRTDGRVERYKARLVAKGYNQVEGIAYTDSFSPVAKAVTVRLFLTLAATNGWALQQLDVNNAFLHGYLDEDIFMTPPEGYQVAPGLVCKLERSLYGLKQASRQWNVELTMKLQEYGFIQSAHDHCLFLLCTDHGLLSLLVYVDDILLTGPSIEDLQLVKTYLHDLFTIKDIGDARYFLGLEIARNSDGIYLAQTKYIQDIIAETGLQNAKTVSTPFPQGSKLSSDSGALLQTPDSYRRLVGHLLYLGFTRPDISHSIQQLSQYLNRPCASHWNAALHVVRYLKGCPSRGLFLPADNSLVLKGYCDADWASCPDSRRSLTGFCIFLGGALVSWKTKKQSTVSRSTAEAKYRSLAATVCELSWLSYLLADFGVPLTLPIDLFCDNKAAIHILANPVFHERTKHIEMDCHLVRDAYKEGFILPIHVRSSVQFADLFTKVLPLKLFAFFLSKLGLVSLAPSPACGGLLECVVLMLSLLETKKMKLEQGMKLLVLCSWTKDRKACFCLLSILSSQLASHLFCIWLGHVTCVVVREIETRIPPTHGFLALKFRFWFFIFPHILDYINSTQEPTATLMFQETCHDRKPAPKLALYSSRGPSQSYPLILKPDVIAPGDSILASWQEETPVSPIITGNKVSSFNIDSGTSMAAPHAAGMAALLKGAHPDWSPAAIRSAMMTTADVLDNLFSSIQEWGYNQAAIPLGIGAGHINPNKALDPGLIYDADRDNYVNFLCALNLTQKQIRAVIRSPYSCSNPSSDLNYPSFIAFFSGNGTKTVEFQRTLTNVGSEKSRYLVKVQSIQGFKVSVVPERLVFRHKHQKQGYKLKIEGPCLKQGTDLHGLITWVEIGGHHVVRSPIVVTSLMQDTTDH
ncbi:UNVERIFIED_CONTAM: Retrovirus-related Pol polyprotein from transposon RE2 [Sesamum latifolium]|uniref:Retrovirus-related Pol polyprotein from transposon RE2 n=1 Tax=Sesamum latifolium TaxID=2727402 RepID=A0AAW2WBT4_9LAMI